ncbi:MAG: hypothetical protein IPK44_11960 [Candidatus Accumulibacter sp.]|uniref:hypothetical protein n=1 Tax=Accumulibacter sp. TaxID=2053492 RepID=UPI002582EA9F|nr:hypothetical protein [Accumulibacter sp.]MBK8115198.1 hypothetical protein [Accumulibacter sp.]
MLDNNIKTQLRTYLEKLQQPIELIASLDGSGKAQEMLALLQDIAALSTKVSVRHDGDAPRKPSLPSVALGGGADQLAGIPVGHEFTSLILALPHTGGHPPESRGERDRGDPRHTRSLPLRNLHLAFLLQLP